MIGAASTCHLSIDPGKKGAAIFWVDGRPVKVISFYHTHHWWVELYWQICIYRPAYCVKERVHAWAGQGLSSTEVLVRNDAAAIAIVEACQVPTQLVEPTEWQRALGVPHFHDEPDAKKRRAKRGKWLKEWALARYAELQEWTEPKPNAHGKLTKKGAVEKEAADIWAAAAIGAAYPTSLVTSPRTDSTK